MDLPFIHRSDVESTSDKVMYINSIFQTLSDPFAPAFDVSNLVDTISVIVQSKGGIGKTTTAAGVVHSMTGAGCHVALIEADTDPPDFAISHDMYPYVSTIEATAGHDIEEAIGVMTSTTMPVVMNTGAHTAADEQVFLPVLGEVLPALGKKVRVFIPVDTDEAAHENALRLAKILGDAAIVVRNMQFGREKDFRLFRSDFWQERKQRGLVIDMPAMVEPLRRAFRTGEPLMSLAEIEAHGDKLHRIYAHRFRQAFNVLRVFEP
jgi:hypothetical protein